jgi:hypothetical protein
MHTFFLNFFTLWLKYLVKQCVTRCIFFQGNPEGRNPAHIIIYTITERTGKRQEKIRKTTDDRKTELPRNRKQRRRKVKFSGNKEVGKTVRMDGLDTQSGKKIKYTF